MLRDKSLIPLSRQHQHALALCVRIERSSPISEADLAAWRAEITQLVEAEIQIHFAAEEQVVFPVASSFQELSSLVQDLLADHASLRESFARTQKLSAEELAALATRLATHIRREERLLFERMQQLLNEEELAKVGKKLETALQDATKACAVPAEATRLKARK